MHPAKIPISNLVIEFAHRLGIGGWSTNVVPRRKQMAGVEADPDAGFVGDEGDNAGEVVEGCADEIGVCVGLGRVSKR